MELTPQVIWDVQKLWVALVPRGSHDEVRLSPVLVKVHAPALLQPAVQATITATAAAPCS